MKEIVSKKLADSAFSRFNFNHKHIHTVQEGIRRNRAGEASLYEIQSNPDILRKRLAREHLPPEMALERINGVPNFQDILVLKKIFKLADCVGRIVIGGQTGNSGYATGFQIAPGIVITNHHVFPDAKTAKQSFIQFDYELNERYEPLTPKTFSFKPEKFFMTSPFDKKADDPFSGLDFTIVAINEVSNEGTPVTEIPNAILDENLGKIVEGEHCVVIQHPKGDYKKIVLRDIRMLTLSDDFLIYESDTLPGSSGAMVVGLGTGEVVALHHSGVPKKDDQGRWLRKDGGIVRAGDRDEDIDWIGNEGIRVSSILKAIRGIEVPKKMEAVKKQLLEECTAENKSQPSLPTSDPLIDIPDSGPMPIQDIDEPEIPVTDPISDPQISIPTDTASGKQLQFFEIQLSDIVNLQIDWIMNHRQIYPGILTNEAIFPLSTVPEEKRYFYISLMTAKNPWDIAEELEALPQIDTATPDLPADTDVQREYVRSDEDTVETTESVKNRFAKWNEPEFIDHWKTSYFTKDLISKKDWEALRAWNRKAVNMPAKLNELKDWSAISSNLSKLKLVQLDTGYTDLSKVENGYNLSEDMDFIDNDNNASDAMDDGLLKYPGHGTRTASIVIGNSRSNFDQNGNYGLLFNDSGLRFRLIPYRISQSVVLIGRGKNLVDSINHAAYTNADVVTMSMGSYPRPMLYEVAKSVYDRGLIWICAAGNEVEMVVAPALYPGTVAVAAFNPNRKPWKGSSYGTTVDVSAPGEDVYVPFENKDLKEIMAYGSGTSYATPHVASAAILWKAKHLDKLSKYNQPWQVVEAFRHCLRVSASKNKPSNWDTKNYGSGLLDIQLLLAEPLPAASALSYAYSDSKGKPSWDLGIREGVHYLWQVIVKKIKPGPESFVTESELTPRALAALEALANKSAKSVFESTADPKQEGPNPILKMYFESYQ